MIRKLQRLGRPDALEPDPELTAALAALDPSSRDPDYWPRFRWWVESRGRPALARRRRAVPPTPGDLIESWAKALFPAAALVTALAGMMLLGDRAPTGPSPAVASELRLDEVEGAPVPIDAAALTFAAEVF
jgi:hypothetical protein